MSTVTQRRTCRVQSADATPGGTPRGTAGTPTLVAYGYGWIAEQAKTTPGAVRSAASRGELDIEDPRSVCRWLDRREAAAAKPLHTLAKLALDLLRHALAGDAVAVWLTVDSIEAAARESGKGQRASAEVQP